MSYFRRELRRLERKIQRSEAEFRAMNDGRSFPPQLRHYCLGGISLEWMDNAVFHIGRGRPQSLIGGRLRAMYLNWRLRPVRRLASDSGGREPYVYLVDARKVQHDRMDPGWYLSVRTRPCGPSLADWLERLSPAGGWGRRAAWSAAFIFVRREWRDDVMQDLADDYREMREEGMSEFVVHFATATNVLDLAWRNPLALKLGFLATIIGACVLRLLS